MQHVKELVDDSVELKETKSRSRICKTNALLKLQKKTNKSKYKCEFCNFVSDYKYNLVSHIKKCSLRVKKAFACEVCKFETNKEYRFNLHMNKNHKVKEFNCDYCNFSASYTTVMERHMKLSHNNHWEFKKPELICHVCEYKTTFPYILKNHMNKHTAQEKFKCDFCDFVSLYKNSTYTHMKKMHTHSIKEVKNFTCNICKFSTDNKWHFEIHMNKHTRSKIFKCDLCNFATLYKSYLGKHKVLIHNHSPNKIRKRLNLPNNKLKSKDKKCNFCDFSTYTTNMLIRHVSYKHPNGEILRYQAKETYLVKKEVMEDESLVPERIQTDVKVKEEIIEIDPIELVYTVKHEVDDVVEKSLSDMY